MWERLKKAVDKYVGPTWREWLEVCAAAQADHDAAETELQNGCDILKKHSKALAEALSGEYRDHMADVERRNKAEARVDELYALCTKLRGELVATEAKLKSADKRNEEAEERINNLNVKVCFKDRCLADLDKRIATKQPDQITDILERLAALEGDVAILRHNQ